MAIQTSDNKWAVAKFIVDPTAGLGDFTTITAAMAAVSSGDVVAVRQGTYPEDFTIPAGVTLTTMGGASDPATVEVVGKITMTDAGTSSIYGIRLTTNGDFSIVVSGTSASILKINNCFFNTADNTAISFTSSSASSQIFLENCNGDLGTTGIKVFENTGSGSLIIFKSRFTNSGASTTANTCSSGSVDLRLSEFNNPITMSATGANTFEYCIFYTVAQNVTSLTLDGGSSSVKWSRIQSGTAVAVSIASASAFITNCSIESSNVAAIDGVGTLNYSVLTFGTSSNITTTTQVLMKEGPSALLSSSNAGLSNSLTVENEDNTNTSSHAIVAVECGGTSGGDALSQYIVPSTTTWSQGIDNSATVPSVDPFVLSQGTALGTNNVMEVGTTGTVNLPLQPAFLANYSTSAANVTGNGTIYTIPYDTEIFDQNADFNTGTGIFTAPVAGRYLFLGQCVISTVGAASLSTLRIQTSNRAYLFDYLKPSAVADGVGIVSFQGSTIADMDANDTAKITIALTGTGADTAALVSSNTGNIFSGALLC